MKNTNTTDSAMAIPASETQARATTGRVVWKYEADY